MNPIVVIATHQRREITTVNVLTLLLQTVVPKVVLVVSDINELQYYRKVFPEIKVVFAENSPLGKKWQAGVTEAYKIGADPVIITGSDDILERKFVEKACAWMQKGFHFVGVNHWYVYSDKLYHFEYLSHMPLGGGRCYSLEFLRQFNGDIFEKKQRHLDDLGWNRVKFTNVKRIVFSDPLILSIKGNWPVMNKAEDFFKSKNCRLKGECDVSIMQENFNYDRQRILQHIHS